MKKLILFLCVTTFAFQGFSQKAQIDLPITWDDTANVDYSVIDFGDDSSLIASDPSNASNIVLKVIKKNGSQTWAGTVLGNDSLANAIPFTAGNTLMRAVVYAPDSGTTIRMKVEDETNGAISVETDAETTVGGGWDTLTFDFSNHVSGTPAIDLNATYDKIAMFFNFGTAGTGETYYLDYVEYVEGVNKPGISLPITWDDTANVDYSVIDFGGDSSYMDTDPNNASNLILSTKKTSGAQVWAGVTFGNSLGAGIPFEVDYTTVRAVVYSPDSGITVKLKVEDSTNPAISVETDVETKVANAWDTLSFDFANHSSGTAAINYSSTYDKMSIFYDFGIMGSGKTYHVDYVEYVAAPPKATISLPIDWDDSVAVDLGVLDFGGNVSKLAKDPVDSTNTVLQSEKTNTAQTWAGTSFGSNIAAAVPFSSGNTIIQAVVYSPDSGITVKLKVEDQSNAGISVETDVETTVANAWDTLSFDFNNHSTGTAVIDFNATYDKMSIFYNFGVDGATAGSKTYYVDDIAFGSIITGISLIKPNPAGDIKIYPNPAKNWVTIAADNPQNETLNAQILNSVGQVVYSNLINDNANLQVDLSQFANGLYFVVVQSENVKKTSKLFISK